MSRKLPSMIANRLISKVTGVRLHDYGCSLKLYRREAVRFVKIYGELHRFIPALAADLGARVVELPVSHRRRTLGRSKYGLSRTLRVILDLLTVKFLSGATRPIQLFNRSVSCWRSRGPAAGGARVKRWCSAWAGRAPDRPAGDPVDRAGRPVHLDWTARRAGGAHLPRVPGQADLPHPRGGRGKGA
jgi:hypothetical protein